MDKSVVRAVSDKVATPTCAVEAATLLEPFLWEVPLGGILHCCNRGSCTWQEYAQWALDCAVRLGAPLKAVSVEPMVMQDLAAFVAKRPPYSAMSTAKLVHLGGRAPKFWQDAVEAYVRAILTR
jgi:dTDP-4-dehydrorhamnose reductase